MNALPGWVGRVAIAAGAILVFGSLWQIGGGNAHGPWSAALSAPADGPSAEAAAALRQAMSDADAAKRQAELALQLLDDVCVTRGRDRRTAP
jgi:hypothetical protein